MASARGTQLWPSLFFVHLLTIIPPVPESRGGLAFAVRSPWPLPTPSFLLKISALSQIFGRSRLCSRGQAAASAASNPAGIMDSSRSRLPRAGRGEGKLVAPLIHEILKDARRASSSEKGGKTRDLYHKPRSRVGLPSLRGWEYTIRDRYQANDW